MSLQTRAGGSVPRQLFFRTAEQRTALARQMFFEEGRRPSGLVAEPVIQSWMRCLRAQGPAAAAVVFEPVSASRLHATLNRNRELMDAAQAEIGSMEASLAGTDCRVLLTDARGVIVHATHNPLASDQPILRAASRVGVNIAENQVGTTAPGIVVQSGHACTVTGAEHFYESLQQFQCAAAPIRDVHGQLAAVLDISIESRSFGFDAASVVGLYATTIENRLLQAQSRDHLVLRFQASPAMLGGPLEGLAGVRSDGQVSWLNGVAARLLGPSAEALGPVEAVFGLSLPQLLRCVRDPVAQPARLPSGLGVWVQARLQAPDGVDFGHAVAVTVALSARVPVQEVAPAAAGDLHGDPHAEPAAAAAGSQPGAPQGTLGDHSRQLIEATLAACGGNIAKTARTLGVSRGMLYRRLRGR